MRDIIYKAALFNAVHYQGSAAKGPVMQKVLGENPELRPKAKEMMPLVDEVIEEVNALSPEEQSKELERLGVDLTEKKKEVRRGLKPLDGADSGLVMRFAPGPSGPLHIGHSRAAILNDEFCRMHEGKFILRLEDTNPEKVDLDAYEMIPRDLEWLGIKVHETFIQSERLEVYYEHALKLLEMGKGYMCKCPAEDWRRLKEQTTPCPHRDLAPEEQILEFDKMLAGDYDQGEISFMVKTDIAHPNPAVRDFVGLRINRHPHPRTGDKYFIYPLYNFSVAVDDHLMGCTHILRGKDHLNNTYRQEYVYDYFGWDKPVFIHYGFVSIADVILKTSKIKESIGDGTFTGWDDVRLGTFRALKRRGFDPRSLRDYWAETGMGQVDIKFSFENLYSYNKKLIDKRSNRYFFVADPVEVALDLADPLEGLAPLHPEEKNRGNRLLSIGPGKVTILIQREDLKAAGMGTVLRLKDLANFSLAGSEGAYTGMLQGSGPDAVRGTGRIYQWVPKENSIRAVLLMPDGNEITGRVEKAILNEEPGTTVQFERMCFAILEQVNEDGVKAVYTQS